MAFGIVRKDKAQIEVEINGSSVKRSIADIQKDYRRLNREINQLAVGSKEFNEKAKELGKVKEELGKARTAANNFGKSQGLLGQRIRGNRRGNKISNGQPFTSSRILRSL